MRLAPTVFPLLQLVYAHGDRGDFGLSNRQFCDRAPGAGGLVVIWLSPIWSGGAGHDRDSAVEGTVERPEEKLAAGGCRADPLLDGEEGFVGWIRGGGFLLMLST